jgi:hypothetical protein
MRFAVIMTTYYRKNKSSKNNILNCFKFLENQKFKNFKLFIMGDHYENENEFSELTKRYNGDLFSKNCIKHYREGYFNIQRNKWAVGGVNALFEGICEAINEKFEYYVHLDDDDIWTPEHILNINNAILQFNKIDFIICCSKYKKTILPRKSQLANQNIINNYQIRECDSVHSSWCTNLNFLKKYLIKDFIELLKKIENIKNKKEKEINIYPFDASVLKKIKKLQKNNLASCFLIKKVSVIKKSDVNIPK